MEEDQISTDSSVGHCARVRDGPDMRKCLEYTVALMKQALEINPIQRRRGRAEIYSSCVRMYSTVADRIDWPDLVEHTIPVNPGIAHIRQQPRRLRSEKVQNLVRQGTVKPGGREWSSPLV